MIYKIGDNMNDLIEFIKENPKSLIFVTLGTLTVLSIVFEDNQIVTTILFILSSGFGLDIKNFMGGAIENTQKVENEEQIKDTGDYRPVNNHQGGTIPLSPEYDLNVEPPSKSDEEIAESTDEGA